MSVIIFAGPSLYRAPPEAMAGFELHGPARQGDVYRAARNGASAIGLIDGYFEAVPSVWHKEILWALSHGIPVYGSASIGALRAVELMPFGMVGVGRVFEWFRDGVLEDDDEVAVLHGPVETSYMPITEAMVNVRATLECARTNGAITDSDLNALTASTKAVHYKDRNYGCLLSIAESVCSVLQRDTLAAWLPAGRIDQKRLDALNMLRAIQGRRLHVQQTGGGSAPGFAQTSFWIRASGEVSRSPAATPDL